MNIAIDGPSGAGKSTIAKALAKKLNITYLDTGAMYRAIALKVFRLGLKADDKAAIIKLLPSTDIFISYLDGVQTITLDGEDVSSAIREHHISKYASDVSSIQEVRVWLVQMQRTIAAKAPCILDGRDIGTYVLPNAKYKFFLTASVEVRAKRRFDELVAKGEEVELATVAADIKQRDHNDSTRSFAPLKKADDAIEVDSSSLSIDGVVNIIMTYIK